jgi:hypothetical protein
MKITICGSMTFVEEMVAAKRELEANGNEVDMPPTQVTNSAGEVVDVRTFKAQREKAAANDKRTWKCKGELIALHFGKIEWSDAILVLNHNKHGVANYIGANSLMEMALAFHLGKPIYLLNPVPDLAYREEILGMQPTVLGGNLGTIASHVRREALASR